MEKKGSFPSKSINNDHPLLNLKDLFGNAKSLLLKSTGPASLLFMAFSKAMDEAKTVSSLYPKDAIDYYFPCESSPVLYSEIGKNAKDLLFENYEVCNKLSISAHPLFASLSAVDNEIIGYIAYQKRIRNLTADLKVFHNGSVHFDSVVESVAPGLIPGLKCVLTYRSDLADNKIAVQSHYEYAAISSSFGILNNPIVDIDATFGTKVLALGFKFSSHMLNRQSRIDLAVNYVNPHSRSSVILSLNENGNLAKASYYHPIGSLQFGGEFSRRFEDRVNFLTVGVNYHISSTSKVRVRVTEIGLANVVFSSDFLTLSSEFDLRNIGQAARVGLAIAIEV